MIENHGDCLTLNKANNFGLFTFPCEVENIASPSSLVESDFHSETDSDTAAPTVQFPVDAGLSESLGSVVYDAKTFGSVPSFISSVVSTGMENGSFLVCNVAAVVKQFIQWRAELPMVQPFYAVKCNPDPAILRLLASLGCSFDCATMGEIDLVCNKLGEKSFSNFAGKSAEHIVYANPAKMEHMLQFAMDCGVQMTVFDGEDELYKIASLANQNSNEKNKLKLLLRITTDDKDSVCRFSKKFGCPVKEARNLLVIAKSLGLTVAGVSFHVGSGCRDAGAYATAISEAGLIFSWAKELGMEEMTVVDMGGGFPGDNSKYTGDVCFSDIARVIRSSILTFCADQGRSVDSVRFIAEPGRYFVSACTTIATKIYSRKGGKNNYQALYVDDGVYGSFNSVVYDHAHPVPKKLSAEVCVNGLGRSDSIDSLCSLDSVVTAVPSYDGDASPCKAVAEELIPTAVFGPTCDGLDQMCSLDDTVLPRCTVGDWLVWDNMGAYTHTASFVFNGYTHRPNKLYVFLA